MSPQLEDFIHDVHSTCDGLKNAALLLEKAAPKSAEELLRLMNEQAEKLKLIISDYGRRRL